MADSDNKTDNTSVLEQSGSAADSQFAQQPAAQSVQDCKEKTWVAIELVDSEGKPVPGEEYEVLLPDGSTMRGSLDENGTAGVSGIDPGQCTIRFPRLDGRIWHPR